MPKTTIKTKPSQVYTYNSGYINLQDQYLLKYADDRINSIKLLRYKNQSWSIFFKMADAHEAHNLSRFCNTAGLPTSLVIGSHFSVSAQNPKVILYALRRLATRHQGFIPHLRCISSDILNIEPDIKLGKPDWILDGDIHNTSMDYGREGIASSIVHYRRVGSSKGFRSITITHDKDGGYRLFAHMAKRKHSSKMAGMVSKLSNATEYDPYLNRLYFRAQDKASMAKSFSQLLYLDPTMKPVLASFLPKIGYKLVHFSFHNNKSSVLLKVNNGRINTHALCKDLNDLGLTIIHRPNERFISVDQLSRYMSEMRVSEPKRGASVPPTHASYSLKGHIQGLRRRLQASVMKIKPMARKVTGELGEALEEIQQNLAALVLGDEALPPIRADHHPDRRTQQQLLLFRDRELRQSTQGDPKVQYYAVSPKSPHPS